jgi:hypothetical protein
MSAAWSALRTPTRGILAAIDTYLPACQAHNCRGRFALTRRCQTRNSGLRFGDRWLCSADCLENETRTWLAARTRWVPLVAARHRIPLGLVLVSRGSLTDQQLQHALAAQERSQRGKIGDWLQQLGYSSEAEVTSALAQQWACPVYPLQGAGVPACASMLPLPLMESHQALPVHYSASTCTLHVAFSERVDYGLLLAIEEVLQCRTRPSLAAAANLRSILEEISMASPRQIVMERSYGSEATVRMVSSYAQSTRADRVRAADCGSHLWFRLSTRGNTTDLLFRQPSVALQNRAASM